MNARAGFTLVELLVATTMLVLLAAAGLAALSAGTQAAAKTERTNAMVARGQAALQLMASDLRAAVKHGEFTLVSLDVQQDGRHTDTIDFVVAKPPRLPVEGAEMAGGRCEVGYSIDTESGWLLRREDAGVDEDALGGGAVTLAGPYVTELNLLFYDGLYWESGWEESYLPRAVNIEITVVCEDEQELPLVLTTTVPILAQPEAF